MNNIEDIYPAAYLQKGMLIETAKDPLNSTYHDVFAYKIKSKFHKEKFKKTWRYLIRRHELLRAGFEFVDGECYVFVCKNKEVKLSILEKADIESVTAEEFKKPFNDLKNETYRIIVDLFEDCFILVFSFHHCIADGWSISNLMSEFIESYVIGKEKNNILPSYGEFAKHEREAFHIPEIISFWKNYVVENEIDIDFSFEKKAIDHKKAEKTFELQRNLSDKIKKFAQDHSITPDCLFFLGYKYLMEYFSNYGIKQIGLVVNNRLPIPNGDAMFGLFKYYSGKY